MRKVRNGITAIIEDGKIKYFEINGKKIRKGHKDFDFYRDQYNYNPEAPRPGVEMR